ncbi:hypothetical protein [Vaccinia virus]|uniref:Uncharacterized protein n=1 Tax=Vaccinia virus TaxID=10245 RepID=A0A161IY20_VACCV|nr:hypothetical protein [Vaccinia virus]
MPPLPPLEDILIRLKDKFNNKINHEYPTTNLHYYMIIVSIFTVP